MAQRKKETPALDPQQDWREAVPDDRLAHLIKDALRIMTRGLQIRLMDHSVSHGHWKFLRILWEQDGITQRELSERAGVREPTTYSGIKAMEKLGYITRQKELNDVRKPIYLTPKGRALKAKLVPLAEEVNEVAVRGMSKATLTTFRKSLLLVIKNMEEDEIKKQRSVPPSRAMK